MTKRAREDDELEYVQAQVNALLGERGEAHVVWNGRTLAPTTEAKREVLGYVAGGIALIVLRAGSPYEPLVGAVEVVLTLESNCVMAICGVGVRNTFSGNTLARIRRQHPHRVGKTEFIAVNDQLNIGFCVCLEDHVVIPDEVGDDQILDVADVLHESALPGMRVAPLQAYPMTPADAF